MGHLLTRRVALLALFLLGGQLAAAQSGCSVSVSGPDTTVECKGDVPDKLANGDSWDDGLAAAGNATALNVTLTDVSFNEYSLNRALRIILNAGSRAASVSVNLDGCSMKGAKVHVANAAEYAGSRAFAITLRDCVFEDNTLNVTGAVAAQENLSVDLKLIGSVFQNNGLMAVGAAAVGATGKTSIQLSGRTVVAGNNAALWGALAVGGDGTLETELAGGANVTGNTLTETGVVAVGGRATSTSSGETDSTNTVEGNTRTNRVAVIQQQPAVATALKVLLGAAFKDGQLDMPGELRKLQGELCAALAAAPAPNATTLIPADLQQLLQSRLCNGTQPSTATDLGSLAPTLEQLLGGGLAGLAGQLDGLLGTNGTIQGLVAGLANGSLTDTEQLGPALDKLLSGLLTSPAGNEVAGWLSDLLDKASAWLSTPIGGGSGSGSNGTASPGSGDLGSAIGSILSNITSTVAGIQEGAANGTADAGQIAGSVVDGLGGIIDGLLGAITSGGNDSSTTPGDILNQVIGGISGALGTDLQGTNLTGLLPILSAVLDDPQARQQLPGLLQSVLGGGSGGSGSGSALNLGPLISAVLGNQEASAALPDLLGLLGKLGIGLPGAQ